MTDSTAQVLGELAPPGSERFLAEALVGLTARRKRLSPKWLYDERGSALYERICEVPEYYPARTELGILERHAPAIAAALGPGALVFELGAGVGRKTELLLRALDRPAAYLPVDICAEPLARGAAALAARFPRLEIHPVVGDFTDSVRLPAVATPWSRRVSFFPGSTIGNFDPPQAVAVLRHMAREAGPGGALVVGVDAPKDRDTLERAYDDAGGVTAAFDLNLLARMNRELGARFRLSAFRHRARWDARRSRVEMHLVSLTDQVVELAGHRIPFRAGESIHTESAYKWGARAFDSLAARAGWRPHRSWFDDRGWFSVRLYTAG
jgi:L-histidine Nalpha-methyltransferase